MVMIIITETFSFLLKMPAKSRNHYNHNCSLGCIEFEFSCHMTNYYY